MELSELDLSGLIPIVTGVWCLLAAVGILPVNSQDPEKAALWRRKFGPIIAVLSPLLIVFGIAKLVGFVG